MKLEHQQALLDAVELSLQSVARNRKTKGPQFSVVYDKIEKDLRDAKEELLKITLDKK